ncbi:MULTISPECIES: hypothetical protein [unclassified Bosea (in: a-proteobacteria)]|uniref:hypothetical protein n=1 Tax=unclassified Bosea (in: a-proteobacteria) TaxID=2653178 RepID=UPI000F7656E5|nr:MULTISPECIES: hypothetical protein [unclassified Bosea (in: a-proteobacteria)]AZO76678.1 hypothetical protein BLM15_02935 [Bosea sp. Tri-49]RXT21511.1 hypothetical protein B5U98_13550 [Bosea sp. Tri-39]RXT31850.1 hypothetical protein B5U99_24395 [Bosea sp. Tri-54]
MTQHESAIQRSIKLGDVVRLSFGFADQSGSGEYEIVRIMPTRASGEREYRVRGADGHERAIGHDQIVLDSLESVRSPAG